MPSLKHKLFYCILCMEIEHVVQILYLIYPHVANPFDVYCLVELPFSHIIMHTNIQLVHETTFNQWRGSGSVGLQEKNK